MVIQKLIKQFQNSPKWKYEHSKCPEEVYLAEKLIELHEWSDMARLARSGGEANAKYE